jgi:cyclopropane fatty-acyl-phospholipid synthase-like methyltransferase
MSSTLSSYNFLPSFEDFRERAQNAALSLNEKCGFAEAFRSGQSARIFADICSKLTMLTNPGVKLLDIGAGCTELALHIVEMTGRHRQSLTVIDSPEMLSLLPDRSHVIKIEGSFPECIQRNAHILGTFDAILAYSVVQSVFRDSNLFAFLDFAVQLLNDQGRFLIGDIPNATMRKRFMVSASGKAYHKSHYSDLPEPKVLFNTLEPGQLDDGVIW